MKTRLHRNQSGQVLIETVLLAVAFLGFVMFVANTFREQAIMSKVISGPWTFVQGMAESGVWAPPEQARLMHPNRRSRHTTVEPEQ